MRYLLVCLALSAFCIGCGEPAAETPPAENEQMKAALQQYHLEQQAKEKAEEKPATP